MVAELEDVAQRLAMLEKISRAAVKAKMSQVQWHCDRKRRHIIKAQAAGPSTDRKANPVLSRYLREKVQDELQGTAKSGRKAQEK